MEVDPGPGGDWRRPSKGISLEQEIEHLSVGLLGSRKGCCGERGVLRSDVNVWGCLSLCFV